MILYALLVWPKSANAAPPPSSTRPWQILAIPCGLGL